MSNAAKLALGMLTILMMLGMAWAAGQTDEDRERRKRFPWRTFFKCLVLGHAPDWAAMRLLPGKSTARVRVGSTTCKRCGVELECYDVEDAS